VLHKHTPLHRRSRGSYPSIGDRVHRLPWRVTHSYHSLYKDLFFIECAYTLKLKHILTKTDITSTWNPSVIHRILIKGHTLCIYLSSAFSWVSLDSTCSACSTKKEIDDGGILPPYPLLGERTRYPHPMGALNPHPLLREITYISPYLR